MIDPEFSGEFQEIFLALLSGRLAGPFIWAYRLRMIISICQPLFNLLFGSNIPAD